MTPRFWHRDKKKTKEAKKRKGKKPVGERNTRNTIRHSAMRDISYTIPNISMLIQQL